MIEKGSHVMMEYLSLGMGVGRGMKLPCLFISFQHLLLEVTLI